MSSDTAPRDQMKRSLVALERRFAAAKADLVVQQQKDIKYGKESKCIGSSSMAPTTVIPPSKKGNFTFSGHSASEEVDKNDQAYLKLSQTVHENLLTTNVEEISSRKESKVDNILHELLQNGDSAHKYMQGSRNKRIDNWILLDNYVQGRSISTGSRLRALRLHSKRSKKHMSMKQHKKHGSLDLPREFHKFENFKPMHELWKSYMTQLLKSSGKNQLAQCLLDADLHGAIILVAECEISAFTGVSGIMIRETAETFGIVTQDNKFRVVLKKVSVFMLQVDCWKVTLHGDKLTSRTSTLTNQF
ncbi:ribonuclease MRP protein subunit POP4-like isoform X2 [Humulus lupulus]|uniref:ribonuclease MRP protein subunit POP4-like isoform X2 n=1 Tax=Humulus lupulus TaxID=3486 RepID=UPI002B409A81|nr:ribonuclease MRP protein subunit POP4-like isoform X2 [Humulus lupulus]XP_062117214.1 ribonuclease MRP protein subunit POP4-like isoform X2 [Humulus lupulus]